MSDFLALENWINGLTHRLGPGERRRLMLELAKTVRASNQARIGEQVDVDGQAFAVRSSKYKGRVRRKMFVRLKQNRWLRASANQDTSTVEFVGSAKRIAEAHHFGLRERLQNKNGRGPMYTNPIRRLLGIAEQDARSIEAMVMQHLSEIK